MKKEKQAKNSFITVIVILSAAALILSFFLGWNVHALRNAKTPEVNMNGGNNILGAGTMTEVTEENIETALKPISEFSTYSEEYTITLGKEETNILFEKYKIPFTSNTINLTCTGVVKVGYDMQDIQTKINGSIIEVTLPEPKVMDNYIIWDKVECSEKNNIFNPIEFEQYKDMITEIEEKGLQQAYDQGINQKAEENMKTLINGFLTRFEGYEVQFR